MDTGTNDNQKFGHNFGTGYFEIKMMEIVSVPLILYFK